MDRDRGFFRNMVPFGAGELASFRAILEREGLIAVKEHGTWA
jgi:hypothetical protein